ncbi:hypothetical protein RUND412_004873, partial [Rhizina undulata]
EFTAVTPPPCGKPSMTSASPLPLIHHPETQISTPTLSLRVPHSSKPTTSSSALHKSPTAKTAAITSKQYPDLQPLQRQQILRYVRHREERPPHAKQISRKYLEIMKPGSRPMTTIVLPPMQTDKSAATKKERLKWTN